MVMPSLEMALPPAWASMPTELMAALTARISWAVMPTAARPVAARWLISRMLCSVVALLLPSSVSVLPTRSRLAKDFSVMFKNWAMAWAPPSPSTLVATFSLAMTSVNFSRSS